MTHAKAADVLILGTYQWGNLEFADQTKLIRELLALNKPTVLISLMNPYDVRLYPSAKTILCIYGPTTPALQATIRGIIGAIKTTGQLPVTIPASFPIGSGL